MSRPHKPTLAGKYCHLIKYEFKEGESCIHLDVYGRCHLPGKKIDGKYPECQAREAA